MIPKLDEWLQGRRPELEGRLTTAESSLEFTFLSLVLLLFLQ